MSMWSQLIALSVCSFAYGSSTINISILPALLQQQFHLSNSERVIVPVAYFLMAGAFMPLYGYLADKYGRLPIVQFTFGLSTVASVLKTLAPTFEWISGVTVLLGIFRPAYFILFTSAKEFLPSDKKHLQAVLPISRYIGNIYGAVIPYFVNINRNWRDFNFLSVALPYLFATAILSRYVKEEIQVLEKRHLLPESPSDQNNQDTRGPSAGTTQNREQDGVVGFHRSVMFLLRNYLYQTVLLTSMSFILGLSAIPAYTLTGEYDHFESHCNLNEQSLVATFTCSEVKNLSPSDFLSGFLSVIAKILSGLILILLLKYVSDRHILVTSMIFLALSNATLVLNFCGIKILQRAVLFISVMLSGICLNTAAIYCNTILPYQVRALGSSIFGATLSIGALMGFFIAEKLLYVSFRVPMALIGVLSFVLALATYQLKNVETNDMKT